MCVETCRIATWRLSTNCEVSSGVYGQRLQNHTGERKFTGFAISIETCRYRHTRFPQPIKKIKGTDACFLYWINAVHPKTFPFITNQCTLSQMVTIYPKSFMIRDLAI